MTVVVAVLALLVAAAALVLAVFAARRTVSRSGVDEADLPDDVLGLRQEVAALRLDTRRAMRHLAVVRYDAFGDMGGQLSWSVALLDDHGDGLVLTSIHGRSDARTYAKSIRGWSCEQPLSPEEDEAVERARGSEPTR